MERPRPGTLYERESPLRALAEAVAAPGAGAARVVCVRGPAGAGRTALLAAGAALGRDAGLRVLRAQGRPAEQDLAFGVAVQLLGAAAESAAGGGGDPRVVLHRLAAGLAPLLVVV